jgi:hypothetical protein
MHARSASFSRPFAWHSWFLRASMRACCRSQGPARAASALWMSAKTTSQLKRSRAHLDLARKVVAKKSWQGVSLHPSRGLLHAGCRVLVDSLSQWSFAPAPIHHAAAQEEVRAYRLNRLLFSRLTGAKRYRSARRRLPTAVPLPLPLHEHIPSHLDKLTMTVSAPRAWFFESS